MKIKIISIVTLCLATILSISYAKAHDIVILGNTLPPFGYEEEGRLEGFSIDLLQRLLDDVHPDHLKVDIRHVPFARAFAQLQQRSNIIALHFARSPDREDQFKWVGPYHSINMGLIGLTINQDEYSSFNDIKDKRVGVVRGTLLEEILLKRGFPEENKVVISDPINALKMLLADRIDLFAHIPSVSSFLLEKELGENSSIIEEKFTLQTGKFYFAFSKNFQDDFIRSLQKQLDHFMKDEKFADLYARYKLKYNGYQYSSNR